MTWCIIVETYPKLYFIIEHQYRYIRESFHHKLYRSMKSLKKCTTNLCVAYSMVCYRNCIWEAVTNIQGRIYLHKLPLPLLRIQCIHHSFHTLEYKICNPYMVIVAIPSSCSALWGNHKPSSPQSTWDISPNQ